jgi:pimeloyl-ACP methyl ester carboxylesterase
MELIEKKLFLNGLSINYAEAGNGSPMIFLHNGGGFWQSWEHQLKEFAKSHTVYGIDWPGFGKSDSPKGLLSLDLLTLILKEFITCKNLENVILIGNCIGGSAALNYAMIYQNKVSKLLIFNICPGDLIFPIKSLGKLIEHSNNSQRLKSILKFLFVFSFTKTPVKRQFPKILFGKFTQPSNYLYQLYVEKFKSPIQTQSRVNLVFSIYTYNLLKLLQNKGEIPPHLLIWGNQNRVASLEKHGYYHHSILKSSEFKIIKNAGHLCMNELPDEVNEVISDYLSK